MTEQLSEAWVSATERFIAANSDRPLSERGWKIACGLALREHWADVTTLDAAQWLAEYAGADFGTAGYNWTFNGAETLASEYAEEFGEECND